MTDLNKLIQLQEIDSELKKLNDLLGDLPAKVNDLRQEETNLEQAVTDGESRLKEIELELSKMELSETEFKEKIARHKEQLYLVTNNKQYDALMHEIDHLKEELDQQETRDLELREEQSILQEDTKSKAMNLGTLREDLRVRVEKLEQMIAESAEKKAALEARRVEQIGTINSNIIARYERISQARDGLAVVNVEGTACGGCGSVVPPQIVAEIKSGKGVHTCYVCSRFLFWSE